MMVRTKLWYLENFNLRKILTLEERKKVAGTAVMQHVPRKEVIYFPSEASDSVYILKEGKVKIYRQTPDGKEIILNIISPGELFGELGIAGQQEREEAAVVLEDAVVCVIPLKEMLKLMQCMPCLNTEILKRLGTRVKKVQNRLESLICKNAEQRIRTLIKEIAQEHGRIVAGDPDQVEVRLRLTHADIAKLTATCRQSVSSLLKDMEKQGLIKYDRNRIYVKDLSLL
ncbi:Crp/Fnr family transcriptional regulator [Pontibacter diazotrophicus]|uniref:Crp/Fnr family transcriptional regulator n=1 Tax=Pontibacter diazotrophicus TaxID=1400979 RepID=A0A3D8L5G5_9BACT|nr:Crp/Fnr family transcriptional regulator [Pontibacter diazotrophicus]RDV12649.1 Crp/Fnr family transcriptional regulator [Pontibacter diazotrophicus]